MADGYTRGVGTGDQLAQGEATQANQDVAFGKDVAAQLAATDIVQPSQAPTTGGTDATGAPTDQNPGAALPEPQYATGPETPYQPATPMDQVLYGPATGVKPPPDPGSEPVPQHIVRALPMLSAIVQDPTTPESIKAAYSFIVQKLANEMDRNYR